MGFYSSILCIICSDLDTALLEMITFTVAFRRRKNMIKKEKEDFFFFNRSENEKSLQKTARLKR